MVEYNLQRFKTVLTLFFHLIKFIVGLLHFSGLNKIKCGSVVLSLFLSSFCGLMIIYLVLCFPLDVIINSIKCKIMMKRRYCLIESHC